MVAPKKTPPEGGAKLPREKGFFEVMACGLGRGATGFTIRGPPEGFEIALGNFLMFFATIFMGCLVLGVPPKVCGLSVLVSIAGVS
ncbi:hypothetical protein TNIN_298021 [Trichonephila inaurata madagascariensis]|uniref:Uncharacterized protein n=1 Tax=Trichonephila inaurata madagascariensis TaxID=2747483 RepID=A0A8X6XBB8_9ARAC|nr:hypothetical protein TNIN_298021 [Trichonephila inaurata madagascariensis]